MVDLPSNTDYQTIIDAEFKKRKKGSFLGRYKPLEDIHIFLQDSKCPPWGKISTDKPSPPNKDAVWLTEITDEQVLRGAKVPRQFESIAISREVVRIGDINGLVQFIFFRNKKENLFVPHSITTFEHIQDRLFIINTSTPALTWNGIVLKFSEELHSKYLNALQKSNNLIGNASVKGTHFVY